MKKKLIMLILLTIVCPIFSQVKEVRGRTSFNQGDVEFGFSFNIGMKKTTRKETYVYYNYYDSTKNKYESEFSDESIYLQIGAGVGYYIIDGLSIEPEMDLILSNGGYSVSLIGNLCYTFYIPKKNIYPYLKFGYGYSNFNDFYYSNSSRGLFGSLNFKTLNAGAGLKLLYSASMAFRMEINYRDISGSNEYSYPANYSSDLNVRDISASVISLSMGISILI